MDMMLAGRFFAGEFSFSSKKSYTQVPLLGFGVGIMSDLAPLYQVRAQDHLTHNN
jgi:hypothetical protein